MARSHFARLRGRQTPVGELAGRLPRVIAATVAGLAVAALPALAGSAQAASSAGGAGGAGARPAGLGKPITRAGLAAHASRSQPASGPLTVTITSMSPSYAMPGRTMLIAVQVRNVSDTALSDLTLQVLTSGSFTSRGYLELYARGEYSPAESQVNLRPLRIGQLAAGATWARRIHVPVSALHLSCFGVYPLAVQVSDPLGAPATDQAVLPYWPSKKGSCPVQRPKRSDISWIWPLIDQPHQGPCPDELVDNSLAASVAPAGRLGELLAVGAKYAGSGRLTWAVDPALLDSVQTMTQPYLVGGSADCTGGQQHSASSSAASWLHELTVATSGRMVFATPYADTDVAALTQDSRTHDLSRAFTEGQQVAGQILGRRFVPRTVPAAGTRLAAAAWPAAGIANYALLENLAADKISTVILSSAMMTVLAPPVNYTPSAVTSTVDGLGTRLHLLLADDAISAWLGSPGASSSQPGDTFKVRQMFLAETAMIVAEAPNTPRAIVVAPPRHWNASPQLMSDLLSDTVSAPWLRPSTVRQLLALPPDHLIRSQPKSVSAGELSRALLAQVARSDRQVALLESILPTPNLQLYRALFGAESSAWRGGHAAERPARALVTRISRFVEAQLDGLSVAGPSGVTLGGTVGSSTVAISNQLSYPVRVKIEVSASNSSVTISIAAKGIVTVPAETTKVVKLTVHATSTGSATIRLRLESPHTGRILPVPQLVMHVQATRSGIIVLIIVAGLLAVFVFTSAARAIRHGRPRPPEPSESDPGSPGGGPADQPAGTEEPDNVEVSQSELTSTGQAIASQGPLVPDRPSVPSRTATTSHPAEPGHVPAEGHR